jgi:hypothetical protein
MLVPSLRLEPGVFNRISGSGSLKRQVAARSNG